MCSAAAKVCPLCVCVERPRLTLRAPAEPEKHFALLERHLARLRERFVLQNSEIVIMVERNLGFEAEHHERALRNIPLVRHRVDHQAKRFGILTTEEIKYAMMTLLNTMLRDQRVNCLPEHELISQDPAANRKRLREQLGIYRCVDVNIAHSASH